MNDSQEMMIVRPERSAVVLTPVMDLQQAKARLAEFQEFCTGYLKKSDDGGNDGGDFGVIPGAGSKQVLLKSGADKLCEIYGLYDEYVFETKIEDFDSGHIDYTLICVLKSRRDDSVVGSGVGSCSSFEAKYRWRVQQRTCPKCGAPAIMRSKFDDCGWYCFDKKGGCGEKFSAGDVLITEQEVGRVVNPDIWDTKNTVLKMAKKRAKIDAVIGVTRSSGIFTQDLEEQQERDTVVVEKVAAPGQQAQPVNSSSQPQSSGGTQAAAPSSSNGVRCISEAQGKRFFALAREGGLKREDIDRYLNGKGWDSIEAIPRSDYDSACAWAQSGGNV